MAAMQSAFAGLTLRARSSALGRQQAFTSNGTSQKIAMKSKITFQVEVQVGNDEPQDMALKRFRREVMTTGLVQEVRRRRYFENSVDLKKRKVRECRVKTKRNREYPPKTWSEVVAPETSPFNDMFGTPEDIFADVLSGEDGSDSRPRGRRPVGSGGSRNFNRD